MTGWNFDISQAPRGKMVAGTIGKREITRFAPDRVILATKCGKVTLSHYIPDEERWLMLGKNEQPDAWMPWPTHPNSLPSNPFTHISHNAVPSQISAVNGGHAPTDDAVPSGDESTATNPHSLPHPPATVQGSDTPSDDSALAGAPIQDQKP